VRKTPIFLKNLGLRKSCKCFSVGMKNVSLSVKFLNVDGPEACGCKSDNIVMSSIYH
jgi:hypothetical protein